MAFTVTKRDLPNVWSHTYIPHGEGKPITLYRSVPGDTSPWFTLDNGAPVKVVRPERFGPYLTRKEFEQWCKNFVYNQEQESAA